MSNKIDNQIVKVENTNNGGLRAIFNLDGVTLDTPIMGTWDKPVFFGKEIAEFWDLKNQKTLSNNTLNLNTKLLCLKC